MSIPTNQIGATVPSPRSPRCARCTSRKTVLIVNTDREERFALCRKHILEVLSELPAARRQVRGAIGRQK